MSKQHLLVIALILGALCFIFVASEFDPVVANPARRVNLEIGATKLEIEIADDEAERARGLSGRAALAPDHGLLFIFDAPGNYGFWMKEMNFPIDIIWIDENWRIADISKNVPPDSYPQIFYPARLVKYVLEVNVGWADQNNLSAGVIVQHPELSI